MANWVGQVVKGIKTCGRLRRAGEVMVTLLAVTLYGEGVKDKGPGKVKQKRSVL